MSEAKTALTDEREIAGCPCQMNGRSQSDYLDLNGCRVGGFTDMGRECDTCLRPIGHAYAIAHASRSRPWQAKVSCGYSR
ncbi:hypothetical protein [Coleofasciculus sp. E1-EBD-02]|uniref:hypothetical protein n=1 Tax=Coleofasciculus sp. E1-EBD-02 TaxID=3068481 RepID=UPI003303DBB6